MKRWRWILWLVISTMLAACAADRQRVVTAPMDAGPETQPNVALGYVLQHISAHYGEDSTFGAPPMGLDWVREYVDGPPLPGATALRFAAESCTATVTFTSMEEEEPVYHVVVDDHKTGFHWCGEVDAAGNVREIAGPSRPGVADVAPEILFARNAVLERVRSADPALQLPAPAAWAVEGSGNAYVFTSGAWQMSLNRPVDPAGDVLFNVSLTNSQSGYLWHGIVNEFCHVP